MSKQDYDEAEASLKVAKAALALAHARLAKTILRAPFAGILGLRRVSPGEYVAAGKAMVNLEAIDPIKVDLQVPERHAGAIRAGQAITVRVDAFPGREYAGEVYAVDPGLDPATRSVKLRARLPNPDRELQPGMFARGLRAAILQDNVAPGYTLGDALGFLEKTAAEVLPPTAGTDLDGQSREFRESSSPAPGPAALADRFRSAQSRREWAQRR